MLDNRLEVKLYLSWGAYVLILPHPQCLFLLSPCDGLFLSQATCSSACAVKCSDSPRLTHRCTEDATVAKQLIAVTVFGIGQLLPFKDVPLIQ